MGFLTDHVAGAALPAPRNLARAVLPVTILGAYRIRKHERPPAHQIIRRSYERMFLATLGYRIAEKRQQQSRQ